MKAYLKKNKFFISLLSIALLIILSLSIYIVQKQWSQPTIKDPAGEEVVEDPNKETYISALSGSYNRSSKGNVITVSWGYVENNAKVTSTYLYLNDNEGINVTQNRYYDFLQSVFDFPTGENKVRLALVLDNDKIIEKEYTIFVKYIISAKQEVTLENNVVRVTLEYVYDTQRPVSPPEILLTSAPDIEPLVQYVDTQTSESGRRTIARSTFSFTWNDPSQIPSKFAVRWKFNEIPDSFDFNVTKPQEKEKN